MIECVLPTTAAVSVLQYAVTLAALNGILDQKSLKQNLLGNNK